MTTFKHGDRVTCEIDGIYINDARISISNELYHRDNKVAFICQNIKDGIEAKEKLGYKYSWKLDNNFCNIRVKNLCLSEKILDDIEVGDKITRHGIVWEILFRSGELVVPMTNLLNAGSNHTISGLRRAGWKVKQPELEVPAPIKMTVAEIAKKLGHEVEIIK